MSRTRGIVGFAFLVLLAFPRTSSASIIDFIWQMSGPQMIGVVVHCEYDPKFDRAANEKLDKEERRTPGECRLIDHRFIGKARDRAVRRYWLSVDTVLYYSTSKNSETQDFNAVETHMVAVEPLLEVRGRALFGGNVVLHHGVAGVSYNHLIGRFSALDKVGLKFRPVGATFFKKFNVSWTERLYPNGFTPDELGVGAQIQNLNRPSEWVHGFSIGYLW